jgi:hypothetical protein
MTSSRTATTAESASLWCSMATAFSIRGSTCRKGHRIKITTLTEDLYHTYPAWQITQAHNPKALFGTILLAGIIGVITTSTW